MSVGLVLLPQEPLFSTTKAWSLKPATFPLTALSLNSALKVDAPPSDDQLINKIQFMLAPRGADEEAASITIYATFAGWPCFCNMLMFRNITTGDVIPTTCKCIYKT